MKIAFLLESSSQLNDHKIPDAYLIDSEIIYVDNDGIEKKISASIKDENYFKILKTTKKIFTSMPSIGNVITKIEQLLKKYDLVIGICLSKYLSNTYQSWKIIEKDFNNKFWVVDVDDIEIGLIWTIKFIQQNIYKFKNQKELQTILNDRKDKIMNFITLTNVKKLVESGRVSVFKSNLIKFLKLKIIIALSKEKGKLDLVTKVFLKKQVIAFFYKNYLNKIKGNNLKIKNICFLSTIEKINIENNLKKSIIKKFKFNNLESCRISLLVAAHTGINAFGFYLELE